MRTNYRLLYLLIGALLPLSCVTKLTFDYATDPVLQESLRACTPVYPETKFLVLSDLHLYNPALGTTGAAFEAYLADDRKLLAESESILRAVTEKIKNTPADFLLLAGDLTKDGEAASYQLLCSCLQQIKAYGKKIYVVPGNHDIANGEANRYEGDKKERVKNITPEEFQTLFADFGYNEALYREPHSLSYIVEPQTGLWLFALDSCRYRENKKDAPPVTDGKFYPETIRWLETMLKKAAGEKKAVIALFHHGLMEHYAAQEKYYGDYVIDDSAPLSRLFAMYNVRAVFTGHYHANDITCRRYADRKFVYDIETGSLVTYPCPYRVISIDSASRMHIETRYVDQIDTHENDFQEYARAFIANGIQSIALKTMKKLGISEQEANLLTPRIAEALIAHYQGDEKYTATEPVISKKGLHLMARLVVSNKQPLIENLWKDLEPYADNNISIDLINGEWIAE